MSKYILLFFLCLSSNYADAQLNHNRIIVKFKDGSSYIGEKISEKDEVIQIKLKSRSEIKLENREEIILVDRKNLKQIFDNTNAVIFDDGAYYKTKGLFVNTNFALGGGRNENGILSSTSQFNLSLNYLIKNKFSLGLGFGNQTNAMDLGGLAFDTRFINFYGKGRYYLTHERQRFFVTGRMGYGNGVTLNFNEENEESAVGGLHAGAGFGISFASRGYSKYVMEIENNFQKASGISITRDALDNEVRANYDLWIKRFVIKVGIDF